MEQFSKVFRDEHFTQSLRISDWRIGLLVDFGQGSAQTSSRIMLWPTGSNCISEHLSQCVLDTVHTVHGAARFHQAKALLYL